MPAQPLQGLPHRVRQLVLDRDLPAEDGLLVRSFVTGRDEAAFALLVQRHGPMVFGVCRRILGNVQDAEDAFQATFLVLARKAASVQPPDLVGNWLYGVARRTALEARSRVRRQNARERQMAELPHPPVESNPDAGDLRQLIDQELGRLPDRYRSAVVLCDLEGRGRKEVAALLHVPEGTLSSRLATARKLLAHRLGARGLTASATAVAALLASEAAQATAPALSVSRVSTNATILAEKVMRDLLLARLKSIVAATLAVCIAGIGLTLLAGYTLGAFANDPQPPGPNQNNNQQNTQTETKQEQKQTDTKNPPKVEKLGAFTGIHVKQGTVVIRQTGRDALAGDEPRADASVENGTLVLAGTNPDVAFTVEVKELTSLKVDGVGKVTVLDLKGKKLEVSVTRPATVILAGSVEEQTLQAAAGSTVDAQACKGKNATVTVAPGGRALVHVSDKLNATVAAGATVEYFGSPTVVEKVSAGGTLVARDGKPAPPKIEAPVNGPGAQKVKEQAKEPPPMLTGAVVLIAEVDGYTQGTTFNMQKYPFQYTGASALDAEQLKSLSKAGDVPAGTAKTLLSCFLWPKQGDTLEKAALKSDGKKLTGDAQVLHRYGKQGTHVLTLKLEGTIDADRVTLKVVSATVTGTWDSGFPIKLVGEVKIAITTK